VSTTGPKYFAEVQFQPCTPAGTLAAPNVRAASADYTVAIDESAKTVTVTFRNALAGFGTVSEKFPDCAPPPVEPPVDPEVPVVPDTTTGG
jgi:hypothetical protein